eukprot:217967-Rhodomonas_salina.1
MSLAYSAASVVDGTLTVALEGRAAFFEQAGHGAYAVAFDHVVTVHLRSEEKYAAMRALVQQHAAYAVTRREDGLFHVRLSEALRALCYGAGGVPDPAPDETLDCAVQYPVVGRAVDPARARLVSADDAANAAWFTRTYGDTAFMRDLATAFSAQTRAHFALDGRFRRALWVDPTYPWPGRPAIGTADRTLLFAAFAVVR